MNFLCASFTFCCFTMRVSRYQFFDVLKAVEPAQWVFPCLRQVQAACAPAQTERGRSGHELVAARFFGAAPSHAARRLLRVLGQARPKADGGNQKTENGIQRPCAHGRVSVLLAGSVLVKGEKPDSHKNSGDGKPNCHFMHPLHPSLAFMISTSPGLVEAFCRVPGRVPEYGLPAGSRGRQCPGRKAKRGDAQGAQERLRVRYTA